MISKCDFRRNTKLRLASAFVLAFIVSVCVWFQIENPLKPNRDYFIRSSRTVLESLNASPVSDTPTVITALVQKYNTADNEVNVTHIKVENNRSLYTYSEKIGLGGPKLHFFRNEKEESASWKCEVITHGNIAKGFFYLWCIPPDDPEKKGAGEW